MSSSSDQGGARPPGTSTPHGWRTTKKARLGAPARDASADYCFRLGTEDRAIEKVRQLVASQTGKRDENDVAQGQQGELPILKGHRCDPLLWGHFSYEKTSKTSKFGDFLVYNFVNLSIPKGRTNRDVVEQIAREARIPVELLSDDLNQPVFTRGQVVCGFAGDEFDRIADDYDNMQWWVSDIGLNMAIVRSPHPNPHIPTLDDLLLVNREVMPSGGRKKKLVRRNKRYETIDAALRQNAESHPSTQEKVFQSLEGRHVRFPPAEPFTTAGGWMAGFRRDEAAARAWLSKRWSELSLPPMPRAPRNQRSSCSNYSG